MAAEFRTVPLADIIVPERLRMVEEDHALAIQASIVEHGLINPISVRRTPPATKPFKPYTLVTGAHRLRAVELNDEREIEALVVEADKDEAVLLEVSENLFRNELSALDRAMFVIAYREGWERKHGQIKRGGDQTLKLRESPLDQIADEAARGFSVHVAEKLGLSVQSVERAQMIGQKLDPALRQRLRGTPDADNQNLLLKLARLEPARQKTIATAIGEGRPASEAMTLTDGNAKARDAQPARDKLLDRLVATWERADQKTRDAFLAHVGAAVKKPREKMPTLPELVGDLATPQVGGGGEPPDPRQVTIFDVIGARP